MLSWQNAVITIHITLIARQIALTTELSIIIFLKTGWLVFELLLHKSYFLGCGSKNLELSFTIWITFKELLTPCTNLLCVVMSLLFQLSVHFQVYLCLPFQYSEIGKHVVCLSYISYSVFSQTSMPCTLLFGYSVEWSILLLISHQFPRKFLCILISFRLQILSQSCCIVSVHGVPCPLRPPLFKSSRLEGHQVD